MGRYVKRFMVKHPPKSPFKGGLNFAENDLIEFPDVFKLALKFFQKKGVIIKKEFRKLSAKMRWESFTVAFTTDKKILEILKKQVIKSTFDVGNIDDFITGVFDRSGIWSFHPWHLETVFTTNALTGYSEGRKQVVDDLSADEFPYRQVVTVGDGDRVRDSHRPLNEYVAAKDDPIWAWLKTPFSYNCRCSIWPVHVSEGLEPSGYIPAIRGTVGFEFL